MRRLFICIPLAVTVMVCLLAIPAVTMAGDPFEGNTPGAQWGGANDINARAYIVSQEPYRDGEHIVYDVASSDARAKGVLETWITKFWPTEGGNLGFWGRWIMTPATADGHWDGESFGELGSGFFDGKPYQHIVFSSPGKGSGAYRGTVFWLALHCGYGQPWTMKCWIEPAG